MTLNLLSDTRVFGGQLQRYSHPSTSTQCDMTFAVFLPEHTSQNQTFPVMYWLSGLTCTDENFMQKAGAFRVAAELGIVIVAPDTSPRGDGVADDAEGAYDLGLGAGFYLNATQEPWSSHYQMYDYVVKELPELIEKSFPVNSQRSLSGHSMGGHGAISIGLKNAERYQSISAFSPICNPSQCPWGQKAFGAYLGEDQTQWQAYDSSELMRHSKPDIQLPILIDQGDADNFLAEQLKPEALISAAEQCNYPLEFRMQKGYDHSYFFISSFIEDHLRFHARYLFKN